ncbi:hypothetical protein VTJ49DRAFT_3094 [Mycothermus thermophilus]|uniref:C2H2-type domain-containing protein n=1 Tax=Humicola insolens TaxID=85995 RepID=A0ABR3V8C7_HUMIN
MRPVDELDDVPTRVSRVESGPLDDPDVAKHVPLFSPRLGPQAWMYSSSEKTPETQTTTPATLASVEWETETLLDKHGAGMDVNHSTDKALYPCPFRKRNPVRFNVRDHEACARAPFGSIPALIHHIITHHRRQASTHQCRRCKTRFASETALETHLMLPRDQICDAEPSPHDDPEDGIPEGIFRLLVAKEDALQDWWTWESIWQLVFSDDLEVPDPGMHPSYQPSTTHRQLPEETSRDYAQKAYHAADFQPVVELDEVEQAFDDEQDALKDSLREKLRLLIPSAGDDDYLRFLAGQIELVFETHRANVMKQCRSRVCGTGAGPGNETPTFGLGLGLVLDAESLDQQRNQPSKASGKPNRRSRRSTLLQALHYRTPTAPDLLANSSFDSRRSPMTPLLRHSVINPKRLSRDVSRSSLLASRQTSASPGTAANPGHPNLPIPVRLPGATRLTPNKVHRHSSAASSNTDQHQNQQQQTSRELRDSGISMSCAICEAEGPGEGCICRTKMAEALSNEPEEDRGDVTQEEGTAGSISRGREGNRRADYQRFSSSSLASLTRLERQQEELHIDTSFSPREPHRRHTNPPTQNHNYNQPGPNPTRVSDPLSLTVLHLLDSHSKDEDRDKQREFSNSITTFANRSPQLQLHSPLSDDPTSPTVSHRPQSQTGSGSGRFSPESFAQRVLRGQQQLKGREEQQEELFMGV